MSAFKSYSLGGQDVFAHAICQTDRGTFFDIGAAAPTNGNNSYGLECVGWSGIAVDICPDYTADYAKFRKTPLTVVDMTQVDWNSFIGTHPLLQKPVDYLSFDIDEASLPVLRRFPFDRIKFRTLTVEHDAYRFGDPVRQEMRSILTGAGYQLVASDVVTYYLWQECPQAMALKGYLPYEDWYVSPALVDMSVADRFRSNATLWKDVLATGLRGSRYRWKAA